MSDNSAELLATAVECNSRPGRFRHSPLRWGALTLVQPRFDLREGLLWRGGLELGAIRYVLGSALCNGSPKGRATTLDCRVDNHPAHFV